MTCDRGIDAGAYVLHALDEDELHDYAQHVQGCQDCKREVQHLQVVVDTLPMAVPQELPPPVLKDRIMRTVLAEAELLQAAGPEADRVPKPVRRRRLSFGGLSLRPAALAGLATVLVAVGVAGGALMNGGNDPAPKTVIAQGSSPLQGTKVSLAMSDHRGELRVRNLPSAKQGRVYQVWFVKGDGQPIPTHTLFNVRDDGKANVKISESLDGVDRVLVTSEPNGGSTTPSGAPLLLADTAA